MNPREEAVNPRMDPNALWREEIFTDRMVGSIRRLTPIKADGTVDPSRKTVFAGEAQILTPAGALPLNFEIPAADLAAAVEGFSAAVEVAFKETMEELKELRRKASSSLVLPGQGIPPGGGGLGMPPGGKLKL